MFLVWIGPLGNPWKCHVSFSAYPGCLCISRVDDFRSRLLPRLLRRYHLPNWYVWDYYGEFPKHVLSLLSLQ